MRINTIVTLGASAAFGVLAILLAKGWINSAIESEFASTKKPQAEFIVPQTQTVPVLVADIDLNFGDTLTPQSLRIVNMPEDAVPMGVFSDYETMFGDGNERTVVLTRMSMNEPVIDYKISGPGGRGSLSAIITDGMRAVAIRVNAVAGVGGFVLPGDHVDVMLTRDLATGQQDRRMSTDILLQNVRVLGADQNSNQTSSAANVVKTVTLEVTPLQAQKLTLAMDIGSLSLTLRRVGTLEIDPVASVSEKTLLTGHMAAAPRRRARTSYPVASKAKPKSTSSTANVTIIRGEQRDTVSVVKEMTTQKPINDAVLAGAPISETES